MGDIAICSQEMPCPICLGESLCMLHAWDQVEEAYCVRKPEGDEFVVGRDGWILMERSHPGGEWRRGPGKGPRGVVRPAPSSEEADCEGSGQAPGRRGKAAASGPNPCFERL